MIVCPLCEHQQNQGNVCEVCGKELVAAPPVNVPSEVLPELETNSLPGVTASVVVERLPDLDEHRVATVQVAPESIPDLERTGYADAGPALPVEPVPELERTRYADDGQRTQLSAQRTCRYCGNVQTAGVLCDRCGIRLPGVQASSAAKAKDSGKPTEITCPSCGVVGTIGTRCLACASFIRQPQV